ncbi:hypothetical protein [Enterococcus diestrammenae]|uniref:hypothetical protein n=1 Tax=Enterococcus diestrammenae TaxID=1155073 RepID=UPI0022E8B5A7|nr:hypothetical protein [Enterococcus diestrammenae]
MICVYTIYSYEDQEIKDVFSTFDEAKAWVKENREDREDDCRIQKWCVNITREENK